MYIPDDVQNAAHREVRTLPELNVLRMGSSFWAGVLIAYLLCALCVVAGLACAAWELRGWLIGERGSLGLALLFVAVTALALSALYSRWDSAIRAGYLNEHDREF